MTALSESQVDTLRHMLGINDPWRVPPVPNRNYMAVEPGNTEAAELERLGLIESLGTVSWSDYEYWRCTPAGEAAAIASHRTIRASRSCRRYIRFLDARDAYPDLTFREFLTHPHFAEARR